MINKCTDEQRRKIDEIDNMSWKEYSLKKITKRNKTIPKLGDVFLISPKDNMFLYGVVVQERPALFDKNDYWVVLI